MASISTPTSASSSPESPIPDLLAVCATHYGNVWQRDDRLSVELSRNDSAGEAFGFIIFVNTVFQKYPITSYLSDRHGIWWFGKSFAYSFIRNKAFSKVVASLGVVSHISVSGYDAVLALRVVN
ncbi:unnamed protein product [Acanthocheilonema viteae]|uniref:Uncharacterized protein n=1 Tax=Acanthocheilonema viteae TaxID=6277 RepID=A0A498SLX4_ACAVI|nr:unnamed protein product [Acanthocheilonema viteae]